MKNGNHEIPLAFDITFMICGRTHRTATTNNERDRSQRWIHETLFHYFIIIIL